MPPRQSARPARAITRLSLPALLLMALAAVAAPARAGTTALGDPYWWNGFGTRLQGTVVNCLMPYGSYLYAAGGFNHADGHLANNIARWDGAAWDTLTTGTDGWVNCMAVYNNQLYVAGSFANAGGSAANNIAMWDGSTWHDVGGGLWFDTFPANQGRVWGMAVWNGVLYVVGQFGRYGSTTLKHFGVVAWNGSNWFEPGPSFGNPPGCVYPDGAELVFGGYVLKYDGSFHWIEQWDGVSTDALTDLGGGLDQQPYVMTSYNNDLFVGGLFVNAGGAPARFIAQWDGSSWSSLGTGVGPSTTATAQSVNTLTVHDGFLIAGGYFWTAGGQSANYVASWDGTTWRPLGSGCDYTVDAAVSWNGDLYVGGGFTHAGGNASNLIARWLGSPLSAVGDAPAVKASLAFEPARPSPFHDATRFSYTLPRAGRVALDVFDIGGRRIARVEEGPRSAGRHQVLWDGRGFGGRPAAAGVYFARLTTGAGAATRRIVLVR